MTMPEPAAVAGDRLLDDAMYAAAAQGGFGCPRGIWGALIGYSMALTHPLRSRWTLERLDLRPGDRVLEIGCGPGTAVRDVAARVGHGFVAGIDPSEVMIRQATRRNRNAIRRGRVEVRQASMSAIPYPDRTFDTVFGANSIQFSRALSADLREIRRVLRPGGLALFAIQPLWKGGTDATAAAIVCDLAIAMRHAGFVDCGVAHKHAWPRAVAWASGRRAEDS